MLDIITFISLTAGRGKNSFSGIWALCCSCNISQSLIKVTTVTLRYGYGFKMLDSSFFIDRNFYFFIYFYSCNLNAVALGSIF